MPLVVVVIAMRKTSPSLLMAGSGVMASVIVSATLEPVRNTCNLPLTFFIFKLGIVAWCFPCITYANIKHRYEHLNTKGFPDPEHGGSFCNSDCMIHGAITACCGMGWIFQVSSLPQSSASRFDNFFADGPAWQHPPTVQHQGWIMR